MVVEREKIEKERQYKDCKHQQRNVNKAIIFMDFIINGVGLLEITL